MCTRESGQQRRMASFQWLVSKCFTVMDVPHVDPVSDAFGTRWGVYQCPTAFSTVEHRWL